MSLTKIEVNTTCEEFIDITERIQEAAKNLIQNKNGMLFIYTIHTSCALLINEAHEETAKLDMECFLKHIAPYNLGFIQHTSEGYDDSPSHMKSMLLNTSLQLIVDQGKIILGKWQGLYLAEFRHQEKVRTIYLKFMEG